MSKDQGGREKKERGDMGREGLDWKPTAQKMMLMRKKEEEERNRLFEFHMTNLIDMLNVHMNRIRDGNLHVGREDLQVMNSAFVNMVDMHPVFGVEANKAKVMMKKKMAVKKWDGGVRGEEKANCSTLRDHMLQQKQKRDLEYAKQAIHEMSVLEGKQQQGVKNGVVVDPGSFESCKTTGVIHGHDNNNNMRWQQLLLLQQQHQKQQQQQRQYQQNFVHYDRAGLDMYMGMMRKNERTSNGDHHHGHGPAGTTQQQQRQQFAQRDEQEELRASNQSAMMFKKLQKELLGSLQTGKSVGNGEYHHQDKSTKDKQLMQLICNALSPKDSEDIYRTYLRGEMQRTGKRPFEDDKDAAQVLMSLGSAPLEKRARMESAGFRPVRSSSANLTATVNPTAPNDAQARPSNHVDSQDASGTDVLSDLYSLLAQVASKNASRPPSR